ncbi:MAG: DNA repair protein RecO [Planctomycetota bacterium]
MAASERPSDQPAAALVWKRGDFSETSRLVTLMTRGEGKVTALAKGAHRPQSPFLGRLDLLNLVLPAYARQRRSEHLRILVGVRLLHEPRRLREPARFLAASYLREVFDPALPEGRADPELFDVLSGAVVVLERCPAAGLRTAIHGLELQLLEALGVLPDLSSCSTCGTAAVRGEPLFAEPFGRGLACGSHRSPTARAAPAGALAWLSQLRTTPARSWGSLPAPPRGTAAALVPWLAHVCERPPKLRIPALRWAVQLAREARPPAATDSVARG